MGQSSLHIIQCLTQFITCLSEIYDTVLFYDFGSWSVLRWRTNSTVYFAFLNRGSYWPAGFPCTQFTTLAWYFLIFLLQVICPSCPLLVGEERKFCCYSQAVITFLRRVPPMVYVSPSTYAKKKAFTFTSVFLCGFVNI